jgi:hypothetical protein
MAKTSEQKAKAAQRARDNRKKNPDAWRSADLKKNFGITLDDYNVMLESQSGVCAICGNPETTRHNNTDRVRNLAVDHCHTTGKVRGLLCTKCNQGLGNFRDNPDFLAKAISYLLN